MSESLIMHKSNFQDGCTSVNNPVDGSIDTRKCQRVITEEAQVFRTKALKRVNSYCFSDTFHLNSTSVSMEYKLKCSEFGGGGAAIVPCK